MTSMADLDRQIEQLKKCEYIKESEVKSLCDRAKEILMKEENVEKVEAPITVSINFSNFEF
jgi:serine/threonine-protein phosphatase 4 catalytic subunit